MSQTMANLRRARPVLVAAVCLWALAALLAGYAIWAYAEVSGYIAEAIAAGQLSAEESRFDIADTYMARSWQYLVLAVLLAVLAWLVLEARRRPEAPAQNISVRDAGRSRTARDVRPQSDDDDLDDLLSTMEPSD